MKVHAQRERERERVGWGEGGGAEKERKKERKKLERGRKSYRAQLKEHRRKFHGLHVQDYGESGASLGIVPSDRPCTTWCTPYKSAAFD